MSRITRRRTEEPHENHDRWLVSYADFITLMFAFFVVLFASSQSDRAKTKAVSDAVQNALRDEKFGAKLKFVLGGSVNQTNPTGNADVAGLRDRKPKPATNEKLAELTPSFKELTRELRDDIKAGRIQINMEPRGLVISLKEGAFFDSGDDAVLKERYTSIGKLAKVVKSVPNPVRLEGHTDSRPVHNGRFQSNWQLSAARSIAVLEILRDQFSIPERQMAIVGYSDTLATDSNDTEEGRARNRRVDLTILNDAASVGEAGSKGHRFRSRARGLQFVCGTESERLQFGKQCRALHLQKLGRPRFVAAADGQRLLKDAAFKTADLFIEIESSRDYRQASFDSDRTGRRRGQGEVHPLKFLRSPESTTAISTACCSCRTFPGQE